MKYFKFILVIIFIWLHVESSVTYADEQVKQKKKLLESPVNQFLFAEILGIAYSSALASNPKEAGRSLAILTPIMVMFGGVKNEKVAIGFFVGFEAWAFYNILVLDKDKEMREENFRKNLIFFNTLMLTALAFDHFSEKNMESNAKLSYQFVPTIDGGFAQVNYRF